MNYIKYIQYIYLLFAVFFIYDAIAKFMHDEGNYILSLLFAGLAIFMFFFKRKFYNKYKKNQK
ncbi:hypothetical protein [Flavobacterium sp. J27]|uniref:hypothetical protein n=1 Tax=Flavobacterium sp. J27 TaxID=2060419 RepID=UPI00102FF305|nr:hypothetical protein [Flavobacterium sp. J27]